jgi:hypothetical protein
MKPVENVNPEAVLDIMKTAAAEPKAKSPDRLYCRFSQCFL